MESSETGTYCSQFSGGGSTLHTSRNFQVSEGEKNEGLENDVFKTYIKRSFQDVFRYFPAEPFKDVRIWTSFERFFFFGPRADWGGYCSLRGGYCSLLVVTIRYRSLLLVPTFSMNASI